MSALAASYLADAAARRRLAPRTLELRRQQLETHVIPLLGPDLGIADVSVKDIRRLIVALERRGLGGSTIRSCVSGAAAMFAYAARELELVQRNPVRDLERGDLPAAWRATEPRYLSREEVARLLDALTPQFRAVAATCYWAGLRISESLALHWANVDFQSACLHVPGAKTRSSRATVPLAGVLAGELERHREREQQAGRFSDSGLVFLTRGGRSPGRHNCHRAVARAAVKAGLVPSGAQPVGLHDLRHAFAALLLENGMSLAETSRLLRHSNVAVTAQVYAGLTDAALARLGERLNLITANTPAAGAHSQSPA